MKLTQVALRDLELRDSIVRATTPIVLEPDEVRSLCHDVFAIYQEKVNSTATGPGAPLREANADTFPFFLSRSTTDRLVAHFHVIADVEETRLALECADTEEADSVFRLWREQRIIQGDLDHIRQSVRGSLEEIVAALLWQLGAIKVSLGDLRPLFTVDEGKNRSPIYIDVKSLPNYPVTNDFMVSQAALLLRRKEFDALCGVEAGSIAFAAQLASKLARPMFFARREQKFPEAPILEGIKPHELFRKRVVLVDDTLVRGWTKERVIEAIRQAGGIIDACFVIFDRQQGGRESLSRLGVELCSLTDRSAALSPAIPSAITFLTPAEYQEVAQYFASPADWHRRRGLSYCELTPNPISGPQR